MSARNNPILAALLERHPIEDPVALIVAHPDDETLAAGGSLYLFRRLLLIHVTDGAPRHLTDAAREGRTTATYAAARAAELDAALTLSSATPERITLGIPDQEATDAIPAITDRLRSLCDARGIRSIITHCYEGGHPDHDAIALAISHLNRETIEFAGYHAGPDQSFQAGSFLPPLRLAALEREAHQGRGEGRATSTQIHPLKPIAIHLPPTDLARKRAMLACFHTQRDILSRFDPTTERFRPAPAYDFTQPPHPGQLLYEQWGWMTGQFWRKKTQCAVS